MFREAGTFPSRNSSANTRPVSAHSTSGGWYPESLRRLAEPFAWRTPPAGRPHRGWTCPVSVDDRWLGGGGLARLPPFILGRAQVSKGGVAAPRGVEALDVVEDRHARLAAGAPAAAGDPLALQGREEALDLLVRVAASDGAQP